MGKSVYVGYNWTPVPLRAHASTFYVITVIVQVPASQGRCLGITWGHLGHFNHGYRPQGAEKSTIWPGHIPLFWAAEAPIVGQNPVYRSQMEPLAMGVRHRAQTEGLEHGLRV